ncbi:MAG: tetratricopeptide repeat protein [Phycisphaerae bacterium]|jgi:tetratricopeptide (TPR) repeat protein|nr:tetratricopeptide repeat protein [Phycisphaerae bacterium]
MFRRVILIVALCMLSALQAEGATVYTASGETYKGKVTKEGGKVIVETSGGRVVLKAKTVIHIEFTEPIKPDPRLAPITTQPGTTTQPDAVLPSMLLKSGAMVLGNATRPEPIIYMYMRALGSVPAGQESARTRRQIDLWRAHAHDRLRKAGKKWLGPKDFIRHRKKFVELLAESEKLRKLGGRTRRYSSSKPPPPLTAKQKRYRYEAVENLYQAARSWADPPMQYFLVGVAQMHARKFDRAETAFKLGIKQGPLLAGLHQGLGLAYAKQYKYLSALEAFLETIRLKPDSAEALHLIRETMKLVPGRSIKSALYRRAVEVVAPYTTPPRTKTTSSYRASYVEWLMPEASKSKSWRVAETTMPTPPYDRMEFRQAVGVPLGKHTLVVDAKVAQGAMEVFVRIDGVFVPCKVGRSSYSSSKGRPKVAVIYLTEYELTPLTVPTKDKPAKGGPCTAHALGIFGQMKQNVRKTSGTFTPGGKDKPGTVSCKLLPGESTSPVLSADGSLVGFLAGKTTVALDGAGPDKFISLDEVSSIIKRAMSSRTSSGRRSYSAAKREFTPKPLKGKTFVVYSILGEVFKAGV